MERAHQKANMRGISAKIDAETYDRLMRLSELTGRTVASIIRLALADRLRAYEEALAPGARDQQERLAAVGAPSIK